MMRAGIAAAALSMALMTSADAQDVYIDADAYGDRAYVDERGYADEPAYVDEQVIDDVDDVDPGDGVIVGPRVYGYTYELRPEDCGTFRYWNGEYCADARFEPPSED
ncbi:hypothetical protein [uncultured Hyphomicrobium sp.]|jgi:hypothetical protein|uniref:hypothetical protein n=1 Tax=uncultured Hyphomicrobium sp. TaxID=194373 RepID=UPI0025ECA2E4|nr:hypothetical protein [uncultured Hyphomicrobium sp.]